MLRVTRGKLLRPAVNPLLTSTNVETVNVDRLQSPSVLKRPSRPGVREMRELRAKQKATEAIEGLDFLTEIYGFTKGQFSLLQLLEAALRITGPVHFVISTWTAARHEIQRLQELRAEGLLLSARWLVDFTFARRDPEAANQIRLTFGTEAIRVAQTHAKFALFTNDTWRLVLRTSMNLNMNPRFEDFTLCHDPPLHQFLSRIIDEIWSRQKRDLVDSAGRDFRRFFRDQM